MRTVFCLVGATASGKTALSLEIATSFPVEIISMDSAMVYRQLDIGTAKPAPTILRSVKHHLIDVLELTERYSVGDFFQAVEELVPQIWDRKHIPLIVGGSLMYFNALKRGLAILPARDLALRADLDRQLEVQGLAKMYQQLLAIDPQGALKISPRDWKRIQRSLELYYLTGKTSSKLREEKRTLPFFLVNLYLDRRLVDIRKAVAIRFKKMLQDGLLEEINGLRQLPAVDKHCPAMQVIGYREGLAHLAGDYDLVELEKKVVAATSKLAKHQLTWLKQWRAEDYWLEGEDSALFTKVTQIMRNYL